MQKLIGSNHRKFPSWIRNQRGKSYTELLKVEISGYQWVLVQFEKKPAAFFIELDDQTLIFQYELPSAIDSESNHKTIVQYLEKLLVKRIDGNNSNLPILVYESRSYSWKNTYNGTNPDAPDTSVFRLYWNGGKKIELVEGDTTEEGGNRIDRMQASSKFTVDDFDQMVAYAKEWEFLEECMREAPGGVLEDYGPWRRKNGMGCCLQLVGIGTILSLCAYSAAKLIT